MLKKAFSIALAIMMIFAIVPFSVLETDAASLVITLDPGHGKNASADGSTGSGADGATQWGGVNEYIYNWDITKAAEARLKEYQNCTVYLTKSTADETPGLVPRVQTAVNNGSDGIISIHNNSAGAAAYGASVFTPNLNWREEMGQNSKNCAKIILNKLYGVGLGDYLSNWEGGIPEDNSDSLYYDGNGGTTSTKTSYGIADRLQIIRHAKLKGLNIGMIVECAFVSNQSDVQNFLMNPVKVNAMGVAIADGIAEYYGLKTGDSHINTIDNSGLSNGSRENAVIVYDKSAKIGETVEVRGWSVHTEGIANYKYSVDGSNWVTVAGGFRQDVANATTAYPNCADKNCFDFAIATAGLAAGTYAVKLCGVTKAGNTYDIAVMNLKLTDPSAPEPIRIVLDAGHGKNTAADGSTGTGSDGAVQWGGVNEYIYNWDITVAAKERLSQYKNVEIYMTKDSADPTPGLSERVDVAVNNNCDAYVSIHNNAGGGKGSLCFIPNPNYKPEIAQDSRDCAQSVLNRIVSDVGQKKNSWDTGYGTGLPTWDSSSRTYPDGSVADYHYMFRYVKQVDVPIAFYVECAFLDTQSDFETFLKPEAKRKAFGYAIADGLADYFGLTMGADCHNTIDSADSQNASLKNQVVKYDHTATIGEEIDVRGWSVHSDGVANYKYSVDGSNWVNVAGGFRQDVANATKDYTNCTDINSFNFKIPTTGLAAGNYNVKIAGVTKNGETYDIAEMNLTLNRVPEKIEGDVAIDRDTETGKTYIKDIVLDTTAEELLAKFSKDGCVIKNNNGVTVTTGKLGTGYVVELVIDGYVHETATVIVKGDLDGDAKANSKDIILAKLYIASQQGGNVSKLASDMDGNGTVSATDLDAIANSIVK